MWVSWSHYPLPVNNSYSSSRLLHYYTSHHFCSSIVAVLSDDEPLLTQDLIQRLNYLPKCKGESSHLKHFGKIITRSSSFHTSEMCFHLSPVIISSHFPESIIFSPVNYVRGGINYSLKTYLEVATRGFCAGAPRWGIMRWRTLRCLACSACLLDCRLLFLHPGSFFPQKWGIILN